MARRSKEPKGRSEGAVQLLVFGAALVIAPMFLGKAFVGMRPVGLLMLIAGGFFLWLSRQDQSRAIEERKSRPRNAYPAAQPVDRTPTELERVEPSFTSPRQGLSVWGAHVFDAIEWRRFEALVEALFQQAGFETKSQSHGADEGVDVWLYARNKPGAPVSVEMALVGKMSVATVQE